MEKNDKQKENLKQKKKKKHDNCVYVNRIEKVSLTLNIPFLTPLLFLSSTDCSLLFYFIFFLLLDFIIEVS